MADDYIFWMLETFLVCASIPTIIAGHRAFTELLNH